MALVAGRQGALDVRMPGQPKRPEGVGELLGVGIAVIQEPLTHARAAASCIQRGGKLAAFTTWFEVHCYLYWLRSVNVGRAWTSCYRATKWQ